MYLYTKTHGLADTNGTGLWELTSPASHLFLGRRTCSVVSVKRVHGYQDLRQRRREEEE